MSNQKIREEVRLPRIILQTRISRRLISDAGMEPQVGMVLNIDCAPIAARGAGIGKRAGANTSAF